jgi:putative salt-induced outer membrane protein YdiY
MMRKRWIAGGTRWAVVLLFGAAGPLHAQEDIHGAAVDALTAPAADDEEEKAGFYDTADLSLVITGGNSSATTLGAKNLAEYYWPRSLLRFDVGGLRTDAANREDRIAVGSGPGDFEIVEPERTTTAEAYYATLRYDFKLTDRWYTFAQGGWDRNTFAGYDNRWLGALGAGWIAVDREKMTLKLDLAGTFTSEEPVFGETREFAGLRFAYDYLHHLTSNTDYVSTLTVDENLKDTDDLRADWYNALQVSISEKVALKTGLRLLWRNQPLEEGVPLFGTDGSPIVDGDGNQVQVPYELDPLDTIFTTALVLKI